MHFVFPQLFAGTSKGIEEKKSGGTEFGIQTEASTKRTSKARNSCWEKKGKRGGQRDAGRGPFTQQHSWEVLLAARLPIRQRHLDDGEDEKKKKKKALDGHAHGRVDKGAPLTWCIHTGNWSSAVQFQKAPTLSRIRDISQQKKQKDKVLSGHLGQSTGSKGGSRIEQVPTQGQTSRRSGQVHVVPCRVGV